MIFYAITDIPSSLDHPLGDAVVTFILREDAERFVEEVRSDDPQLASYLRSEERELELELEAVGTTASARRAPAPQ